jgi:hypothetical protein
MTDESFEDIAIKRDLVRRPEVRLLAKCLAELAGADTKDIDMIFLRMANRIITRPEAIKMLNAVLEICI